MVKVALNILADWCEENANVEWSDWVRTGMKSPTIMSHIDFFNVVRQGGMIPLLEDALREVSVEVATYTHPERPGYFTVACLGHIVSKHPRRGYLAMVAVSPSVPYCMADVVKGPFQSPAHAYLWSLVLQSQHQRS